MEKNNNKQLLPSHVISLASNFSFDVIQHLVEKPFQDDEIIFLMHAVKLQLQILQSYRATKKIIKLHVIYYAV